MAQLRYQGVDFSSAGSLGDHSPTPASPVRIQVDPVLESKLLNLFKESYESKSIDDTVNQVSTEFINAVGFSTPNLSEEEIAGRFLQSDIPEVPLDADSYFQDLIKNVVEDGIHTSCPQMIGHMTSALPHYMMPLAKLIAAMNQNVVKTETAKTVTFLEREAMAQLHRQIYGFDDQFYERHIQNAQSMLGLFTSGGTLANTSALWIARNGLLGASEDGSFQGVEKEGLVRALKHCGYEDAIVLGSDLMHYSLDKAVDLLGIGVNGLVKIPVNLNYQVDLELMEARILEARKNNVLIVCIVGICGTTETGAIDDLHGMAKLASKYSIHFHVDAAWGGPCIFSRLHRHKARGMELADSVTLDGHKQLWLPMGAGMVFLKDPHAVQVVSKTANYIIRKESYDLGKFTIDGSRGAQAIYLHANLQMLGLQGYEVLFDRTVRMAKYMARTVLGSSNWELLVKPMTNILLYRWLPAEMREKAWQGTLTAEDNEKIDECNRQLQAQQKQNGRTFVSRTTIKAPKYEHRPTVGLRVVIGNPLTTKDDIDAVFKDQNGIIMSMFPEMATSSDPIVQRNVGIDCTPSAGGKKYWNAVWEAMATQDRAIFSNDIDIFYDAMVTPTCFLDSHLTEMADRVDGTTSS